MKVNDAFQRITEHCFFLLLVALLTGASFAAEPTPTMSKTEAKELIKKASTPEDHHRLAAYFAQKAEKMEAEAVEHDELSKIYFENPGNDEMKRSWSATTAGHCRSFAQEARKAAAEDRILAATQEDLAKSAEK